MQLHAVQGCKVKLIEFKVSSSSPGVGEKEGWDKGNLRGSGWVVLLEVPVGISAITETVSESFEKVGTG